MAASTLSTRPSRNTLSRMGFDFDNLFDDFFRPLNETLRDDGLATPAIDITEKEDRYVVKADMPGVSRDDINISVADGVLTINAETKSEANEKDKEDRVIRSERR